ncbi:hypothetical protein D3C84_1177730 [compost metagenome]
MNCTSWVLRPALRKALIARKWPMEPRVVTIRLPFRSAALFSDESLGAKMAVV